MNGKASYFREGIKHQEANNKKKRAKKEGHKEIKMLVWNVAGLEKKMKKMGIHKELRNYQFNGNVDNKRKRENDPK